MPKKEFSSFDVSAVVHELKEQVANSRVNNLYQLDAKTLLLKLHKTDKPPLLLLMEAGRRLHLTAYAFEKPLHPPSFCMALRKHLRNAWLRDIEQFEFERVVTLLFEGKTGKLSLVLELFGEGNLILMGEKGEVLQALAFKRMRDRNILRGELYKPPPLLGKNPLKATLEEVETTLKAFGDTEVVRAIARSLGIGGVYAEELLLRSGIEKTKRCVDIAKDEIVSVYDNLRNLLETVVSGRFGPCIVLDDDSDFLDVVPFHLKRYENLKTQAYASFNEALDQYCLRSTAAKEASEFDGKVAELQREIEKLKRVVVEQEKMLKEALQMAENEKFIGDIVYAHSSELQELLNRFSNAKNEGRDLGDLARNIINGEGALSKAEVLVESFDARNLAVRVKAGNLSFNLSLRATLFEIAAWHYDRGKKAKQKAAGASVALEESRKKLAEIEQLVRETEVAKLAKPTEFIEEFAKRKVVSKDWYTKFRWFKSSEGFLVVAGKDMVSNEVLVKKHAKEGDLVFHADIVGAPFVVVKTEGETPGEQTLREAAEFAAAFSRAWREGLASIDVYWVRPEQLSKTGPSGEYVPRGAFAVIGKRNWMRGTSLQLAIGVDEGDELQFVGGPVDAVKFKTKTYVAIKPGDAAGKELLEDVVRALSVKLPKEKREESRRVSIERIREFVPYTKGRIIEASSMS